MCGIVGEYRTGGEPASREAVAVMRDSISYRGPDDFGLYADGPVALGHRRLSILDLSSAGHQPMLGRDGRSAIVFNGEIYNYLELRSPLASSGHEFVSGSDTEVLLRLYDEYGDAALGRLNGMFSFAIWDARRGRLLCARDPLGIKPFYYHFADGRLSFASEVKALLAAPWITPTVDEQGLADYLFVGFPLAGKTMFKGIRELPPGHLLVADASGIKIEPYWQLQFDYQHDRPYEQVAEEFESLIRSAVELQCRSDAPLGCHLSSGTDSTLISALASQHRPGLPTFTVRYDGGEKWDESSLALLAAESIGARPHVGTPDMSAFPSDFCAAVWHMDAPLPNAGALSYRSVSRLAGDQVKVTLTGHGGDEALAGYPAQFLTAYGHTRPFNREDEKFKATGATQLDGLVASMRRHGVQGVVRKLRQRLNRPDPIEFVWLESHTAGNPKLSNVLAGSFIDSMGSYEPAEDYLRKFREAPTDHLLDRCLYHDLRIYLPALLMMEDRASMAFGVESRVPMLDVRIVEFLATVPPDQKTDDGRLSKRILRDAARSILPPEIVDRRVKAPFPSPFHEWLGGPLKEWAWSVLGDERTLDRGVYHPDVLRDRALSVKEQWRALGVEVWFRSFIDQDPEYLPADP